MDNMEHTCTAVFYEIEGVWVGTVAEIPGVNTIGSTLDEARENLGEAVELALEARRHLGLSALPHVIAESYIVKAS